MKYRFLVGIIGALSLMGCNPLVGNPSTDPSFNPGFDSSCQSTQIDNSNAATGFGGGNSNGTTWDGTNNYVRLNQGGLPTNNSELDNSWAPEWSSIISIWHLDEASGSMSVVDSVSGNTGTVNGGVTLGNPGQLHSGASFDGSTGYLDLGNPPDLQITGNISFQVWVNLAVANNGQLQDIITKEYSTSPDGAIFLRDSTGSYDCGSWNGTNYDTLYAVPSSDVGEWVHLVCTYNGTKWSLYRNGILVSSTTWPVGAVTVPGVDWTIGGTPGRYFQGSVDEAAIWNKALTAAEVATIYNRQSAKYAGTFTSRVMNGTTTWPSLAWTPTLPFFKELPDYTSGAVQNESTTSYSSLEGDTPALGDNNLMTGIVGLWHLDEAAGSGTVLDQSGQGNNGTPSNVTLGVNGKLGTAASFNGSSSVITVGSTNFPTGAAPRTISVWFQPSNFSGLQALFGYGSPASNESFGVFENSGYAFYSGWSGSGDFTGTIPLISGWNHLVLTYNGATFSYYVNGVFDSSSSGTPATTAGNARIGEWTDAALPVDGQIDEVAIWNKALNATEVLELYRRGANRIKYQVRTCPDGACGTNPTWLGPNGTNQTYFSELNNNAIQSDGGDLTMSDSVLAGLPTMTFSNFGALLISNNSYFQYRAIIESDDPGTGCNYGSGATWCSPELKNVKVNSPCSNP